jgi:deoxyribodipyrimidine photo-lyase
MIESLLCLSKELMHHLRFFYTKGEDTSVLEEICKHCNVVDVSFNMDLTPFARARDENICAWCRSNNISYHHHEDYTLHIMGSITTASNTPFKVFTPFFRKARLLDVRKPKSCPISVSLFYCLHKTPSQLDDITNIAFTHDTGVSIHGGRKEGKKILAAMRAGSFASYDKTHDFPMLHGTTCTAAHLKFGTISCREFYHIARNAYGRDSLLVEQIHWRDFYYGCVYNTPTTLQGQDGHSKNIFHYGKFTVAHHWNKQKGALDAWKSGTTGVPIVDAAMRCLNETGWMHNRLRMIVAMFLVRHMNIDWRHGEKYFARLLVDYDVINNNQGWCWALTYRRTLSPWRQTLRFDPKLEFVRTWLPELKGVPDKDVMQWDTNFKKHTGVAYPPPITIQASCRMTAYHPGTCGRV